MFKHLICLLIKKIILASACISQLKCFQGPFEIFSVGGDVSDANVVQFSNDGRLMLLTTMGGHIHVLDSFRGTLVSSFYSFGTLCILLQFSLYFIDEI